MRKFLSVAALAAGLSVCALAQDWAGVIVDQKCAHDKSMRSDAKCAAACIKAGSPAVLVTDDGAIYKISDQPKVTPYAGQRVKINGKMEKGAIRVAKITT